MVDLSILVCSVHTRYNNFLLKIEQQLFDQYNALDAGDQHRVEIVVLTDNKMMMLGHKRNVMVELSQGKYIAFVDDDDRIADDYIQQLLDATATNADSIVFQAEVSLNGEPPKLCYYSKDYKQDSNMRDGYQRIPNHICCVKRSVALKSSFPNILYGEDAGYGKVLLPHLKTEHKIDKVLYYYDYNADTTETQGWRYNRTEPRKATPVVDVIVLSKAMDRMGQRMTQQAVDSCYYGSNGLPVNITVIEGGMSYRYEHANTIFNRDKFNYNKFANMGASLGKAEWIMVANNDLTFRDGWLHHLIAADHPVVSPREPNDPRQKHITANTTGDVCGTHFSGWCFMIKRSLWEEIGKFDEDVTFWCSDDVVIEQVKAAGVMPMVVYDSIVDHNVSVTLRREPTAKQQDLKWRNVYIFNKKYNKNKFASHPEYLAWLKQNEPEEA